MKRGMRLVMSTMSDVAQNRGAETASWAFMPKSMTFKIPCSTAIVMNVPPGAPMMRNGLSFRSTMEGDIAVKRDLPGWMESAPPGRGSKTFIQPLYMNPKPSVTTPEGLPSECVIETQLPNSSTAHTCVVS